VSGEGGGRAREGLCWGDGELLRVWLLRACLRAAVWTVSSSGRVGAVAGVRRFRPQKFFMI
jgi:hypothetical protein